MVLSVEPPVATNARATKPSTLLLVDDNPVNLQVLLRTLDGLYPLEEIRARPRRLLLQHVELRPAAESRGREGRHGRAQ